jgi:hypothetical protein
MKLQLDLNEKTITIEDSIELNEFFEILNNLFPGGKWREYKLILSKINEFNNPITLPNTYPPDWNIQPYTNPIWYGNDFTITSSNSNKINIEL